MTAAGSRAGAGAGTSAVDGPGAGVGGCAAAVVAAAGVGGCAAAPTAVELGLWLLSVLALVCRCWDSLCGGGGSGAAADVAVAVVVVVAAAVVAAAAAASSAAAFSTLTACARTSANDRVADISPPNLDWIATADTASANKDLLMAGSTSRWYLPRRKSTNDSQCVLFTLHATAAVAHAFSAPTITLSILPTPPRQRTGTASPRCGGCEGTTGGGSSCLSWCECAGGTRVEMRRWCPTP